MDSACCVSEVIIHARKSLFAPCAGKFQQQCYVEECSVFGSFPVIRLENHDFLHIGAEDWV
jgi:hypothetical protein